VTHPETGAKYLYVHINNSQYEYKINGMPAWPQQVAALCTRSVANRILDPFKSIHNQSNDVYHDVHVRTIGIENIRKISVNGQTLILKK
jgi:hypothetical protein